MTENKTLYHQFCQTEKGLPIFLQDWYLDIVCDGLWEVVIVQKNGKMAAILPYHFKQQGPFSYIAMPPFTHCMGIYISPDFQSVKKPHFWTEQLLEQLPKFDHYLQRHHYQFSNWLPFYWKGFSQTTHYTYVLEKLGDLDAIFNSFSSSYRNKIRKAEKLVKVKTDRSLSDFYELNKKTFSRQGKALPYSFEFLQKYDQALAERQSRQVFFAEDEQGQLHSALYLIWDKRSAYLHIMGEDPELRNSGAGILLVWEAIQFTQKELGLTIFDFEGSMIPSIEKVRRQFGAEQRSYFVIEKYTSTWFKILRKWKLWLKR